MTTNITRYPALVNSLLYMQHLSSSFTLKNGTIISNRIVKSATSEVLGTMKGAPTPTLINLYKRWAEGGAGLLITGNIMVDAKALGEPNNVVVEDKTHFELLQTWAQAAAGTEAQIWTQINHPGRQAIGLINRKVVAPSAIRLKVGPMSSMFAKPKALGEDEILDIIERYATTAEILKEAGFPGVQIHGAHGYLVSQFLSPRMNIRTDKWGGSLENRARFVLEIYRKMRAKLGANYPIGIKINSADFQRGGFTEEESVQVIKMLSDEGIDMIEISGGTYEAPAMMFSKQSTREREAYFIEYTKKARKVTDTPLMVTGGFRTAAAMEYTLAEGSLDLVGLARPFILYPNFPKEMLNGTLEKVELSVPKTGIKFVDERGLLELGWYEQQLRRIGEGKEPKLTLSPLNVLTATTRSIIQKSFRKN